MICVPCSFVSSSFFIICEFLLLFELLENLFIFFNKAMSGFTFFFSFPLLFFYTFIASKKTNACCSFTRKKWELYIRYAFFIFLLF